MIANIHDHRYVLILSCPDRVGIVAAVSEFIATHHGWILEASHHADPLSNRFYMRQELRASSLPFDAEGFRQRFAPLAERFAMQWQLFDSNAPERVVLLCSKQDHCLIDLLYRIKTGELQCDLRGVISNHEDMRGVVEWYDIPYHCIPVPKDDKQSAFEKVRDRCAALGAETLVLARYMQVLPDWFCEIYPNRIINIHHSFLPSFAGGKPYHQAFERGVKLIGATCHYVTAVLDAGPIIEQDVARVQQSDLVQDLICRGRDVERQVLARGLGMHLKHRVVVDSNKTVILN